MTTLKKKIVVTGGGSGGHANTALGFIEGLEKKFENTLEQILFLGGNLAMEGENKKVKSIEHKLLEKTEIRYKIIRSGKFQRYLNLETITLLFKTIGGLIDSFKILRKEKPDIIFSTGGYVTVPVCIAGWILKIPIYIHEQTINTGLANKIGSLFATKIFITFKQSNKSFPKNKTVFTGNILRNNFLDKKQKHQGEIVDAVREMKKEQKKYPIIYISGGSQGSHVINTTLQQMIPYITQHYQVILQTGENSIYKDYEKFLKERKKLSIKVQHRFLPVKYIDSGEIGFVYKNMDLFVGRSGANTVYELGLLEKPAILIPIPWVTRNEQYENAQILQKLGLAKIIPEGELISDVLFNEINRLFKKKKDFDKEKIQQIFLTNAIEKIIEEMGL